MSGGGNPIVDEAHVGKPWKKPEHVHAVCGAPVDGDDFFGRHPGESGHVRQIGAVLAAVAHGHAKRRRAV